jgi:hypothetical protein
VCSLLLHISVVILAWLLPPGQTWKNSSEADSFFPPGKYVKLHFWFAVQKR